MEKVDKFKEIREKQEKLFKKVKIEVIETRGEGCINGLKVGDVFIADEMKCDFCVYANAAILPFIQTLKFGGDFPWEKERYTAHACCSDPYNTVVFKISAEEQQQ